MPTIEFGTRDAANEAREQWADHLCSDDDRRLKAVTFASSTPDDVLEAARREAEDSRAGGNGGAGQVPLSDHEQEKIDFSAGRANVLHARSVKAIAADEGVSDWLAYYDPTLSVDEHRETMARAAKEGGGKRREDTETATEKAGRAARTTQGEQCNHAEGHCQHGDPNACEFLARHCGYSEDQVAALLDEREQPDDQHEQQHLVAVGGDRYPEMDLTPEEAGALTRSWEGYKGAISRLDRLLSEVREATTNARQAWAAVNAIRQDHGQGELHPDELHDLLASLAEMPGSIPEVRTLDHYQQLSEGAISTEQVLETDDQRALAGDRANDQARLAGGEQGEQGQGEVEQTAQGEQNEGGLLADTREEIAGEQASEQQVPDEFQVAEGGQETL